MKALFVRSTHLRSSALALSTALVLAPTLALAQDAPPPEPSPTVTPPPPPTSGSLTLPDVLGRVEQSYPLLRATELDRDVAEADLLSAEGGFDSSWKTKASTTPLGYYQYHRLDTAVEVPTTLWGSRFFAGYRLGVGDFPSYYGSYETLSRGEVRAGASVPLIRNGPTDRRRATIARAEAGREVADQGVQQQRITLRRAATLRYWDWVAAGRRLAILRKLLATAVERDAALGVRVERGDLPAIERVDNQRTILSRQSQLVSAERGLQQAGFELSLFLRAEDGNPLLPSPDRLPPGLPEPTPVAGTEQDMVDAALRRRPELARYDAQRKQMEAELSYAKNQRLPGLDVQVMASRDLGPDDAAYARRPTVVEASVLLDIPLQNRTATGRADAASANLARIAAQTRFARDRIVADVRDARSALDTARQRVDVARREVSLAGELERAERSRFELGDSTLLIVNLREQASADAALREVDALLDYQRAIAAQQAAVGVGLR
jgi:outer membrane protein, heavy metal efflux system